MNAYEMVALEKERAQHQKVMMEEIKVGEIVKIIDKTCNCLIAVGIIIRQISEWRNDAFEVETEDGEVMTVCQFFGCLILKPYK